MQAWAGEIEEEKKKINESPSKKRRMGCYSECELRPQQKRARIVREMGPETG